MKAWRINTDYESVLFTNRPRPEICAALEFLAFFLEDSPIWSSVAYPDEYLEYVTLISGHRPELVKTGATQNWWGELKNPELERTLNSKLTSSTLALREGWVNHAALVSSEDDKKKVPKRNVPYLAKSPIDMSGRGFQHLPDSSSSSLEAIKLPYPYILEPSLDRVKDFSTYVLPDGKTLFYENIVDSRFQYKGTILPDWRETALPASVPLIYLEQVDRIKEHYQKLVPLQELAFGYSIDSFLYRENGQLHLYPLCEVNVRRTMGRVAWELAHRYSQHQPWCALLLLPATLGSLELCRPHSQHVIHLSPERSRFLILFVRGESSQQVREWWQKNLLSLGEFPVRLEDELSGFLSR